MPRFCGRNLHGLVQMQFARAAVVVEPIGDVGVLLDFTQREPAADGVNCAGGDEKSVARLHFHPVQQLLDFAAQRCRSQTLAADWFPKSDGELRARIGAQDVPHFGFPARILVRGGEIVVGMHLHRQALGSEDKLHQQREIGLKPHFADLFDRTSDTTAKDPSRPRPSRESAWADGPVVIAHG